MFWLNLIYRILHRRPQKKQNADCHKCKRKHEEFRFAYETNFAFKHFAQEHLASATVYRLHTMFGMQNQVE